MVPDVRAQHDLVEPGVDGQRGAAGVCAEQVGGEQLLEGALAVIGGDGAERAVHVQEMAAATGFEIHVDGVVDAQTGAALIVQLEVGCFQGRGDGLDDFVGVHGGLRVATDVHMAMPARAGRLQWRVMRDEALVPCSVEERLSIN